MRIAIALFLILHGMAHSVGFVSAWKLAPNKVPYNPVLMIGDVGPNFIRLFGILWLVTGAAFVAAGYLALRNLAGWHTAGLAAASFSLALCLLALPDARIGAVIDFIIIASMIRYGISK